MINIIVKTEYEEYLNLNIEEDSKVRNLKEELLLKVDSHETYAVEKQVLVLNGNVLSNEQEISSLGIGGSNFILWISKDYERGPLKKKSKTQQAAPGSGAGPSFLSLPSNLEVKNPGLAQGSGSAQEESENLDPLSPIEEEGDSDTEAEIDRPDTEAAPEEEGDSDTETEIFFNTLPKQRDIALFNALFDQFVHETPGPKPEELTLNEFLRWCYEVNIFDIDLLQRKFIAQMFKSKSGNRKSINLQQLNALIQGLSDECHIQSNLFYILLERATLLPETKELIRFNQYTEHA